MNGHKKLFAVLAYRYDYTLLPDLIANLDFVDGFIIHDDRHNNEQWYHEGRVRNSLLDKARRAGADWVLCIDPDERLEKGAGKKIRKLIQTSEKIIFAFPFRELWTENQYRVDGVWGKKKKPILFPLLPEQEFQNLALHSNWHPVNSDYRTVLTDINLYHLKNIRPENRQARADLYNKLDPNKKFQDIGYDYLADEEGMKLKKVSRFKPYFPRYNPSHTIVQHDKQ